MREPIHHEVKILPEYFDVVDLGYKKFEIRRDDRGYEVGDTVLLREWSGDYTGRDCLVEITYITNSAQIEDYIVMSIIKLGKNK